MVPVEKAVTGLLRGIERRKERIVIPRWMLPVVVAPGLIRPMFNSRFKPEAVQRAIEEASPSGWSDRPGEP